MWLLVWSIYGKNHKESYVEKILNPCKGKQISVMNACTLHHQLLFIDMRWKVRNQKRVEQYVRLDLLSTVQSYGVEVSSLFEQLASLAEEMTCGKWLNWQHWKLQKCLGVIQKVRNSGGVGGGVCANFVTSCYENLRGGGCQVTLVT